MIDTKVKVNGQTVGEYDFVNEPCVKTINGERPDDNGNIEAEGEVANAPWGATNAAITYNYTESA